MNEIFQEDVKNYISRDLGTEHWVTVYGRKKFGSVDVAYYCGLLQKSDVEKALSDCGWDQHKGDGYPGFNEINGNVTYEKYDDCGNDLIIIMRDFHGIKESYGDVSQEFILLNNLYHDKAKNIYYCILNNGELDEVIRINELCIDIKRKYLLKYSAAKQKHLAIYFDARFNTTSSLEDLGIAPISSRKLKTDYIYYDFWIDEHKYGDRKAYSVLMGKKLLSIPKIEECGYWPFDKEKNYQSYIIGQDSLGNDIEHSSNPKYLNNYFGSNPDEPMYLTPVYFKREVLIRYFNNPDLYTVADGYIHCKGLWGLQIDNHNRDYVSVYLGDLGRDLPELEELYWKAYNFSIDGRLSEVKFKRDFLSLFTEAEIPDLKFKSLYQLFVKEWEKTNSWNFYLPPKTGDEYIFDSMRIPLNNTQPEFDTQVLVLCKLLIDFLNEKQIRREYINETSEKDDVSGISLLEKWLKLKNMDLFDEHISFLRNLQALRSSGSAHKKGRKYLNALSKFKSEDESFIIVFEKILHYAIGYLEVLYTEFLK